MCAQTLSSKMQTREIPSPSNDHDQASYAMIRQSYPAKDPTVQSAAINAHQASRSDEHGGEYLAGSNAKGGEIQDLDAPTLNTSRLGEKRSFQQTQPTRQIARGLLPLFQRANSAPLAGAQLSQAPNMPITTSATATQDRQIKTETQDQMEA